MLCVKEATGLMEQPWACRDNDPQIHYGTIGSGNAVIKNGTMRDQLRKVVYGDGGARSDGRILAGGLGSMDASSQTSVTESCYGGNVSITEFFILDNTDDVDLFSPRAVAVASAAELDTCI